MPGPRRSALSVPGASRPRTPDGYRFRRSARRASRERRDGAVNHRTAGRRQTRLKPRLPPGWEAIWDGSRGRAFFCVAFAFPIWPQASEYLTLRLRTSRKPQSSRGKAFLEKARRAVEARRAKPRAPYSWGKPGYRRERPATLEHFVLLTRRSWPLLCLAHPAWKTHLVNQAP